MAVTKLTDIIEPDVFAQYVIDRSTEKSLLVNSGIVSPNPLLDALVTGGGSTINMPSWNDLSGSSQVLDDTNPIETDKITAKSEIATMLIRGKGWAAHELSGALAGSDPMQAIGELVSDFWIRDEKKTLLSILKGIFESADMAGLKHDVATAIDAKVILDAKQKLGDAADVLTAVYMHSMTYTALQKQNVIEFVQQSDSKISMPTFLGYRVIYDDSAPVTGTGVDMVYTTYLLSAGAIARGTGVPVSLTPVETDRDSAGSTDYLFNRQAKVLHPRGISWIGQGNIAKSTPEDTELATGTNWKRVAEIKKIGLVQLTHKV